MSKKREAWEDELWSYINAGNGIGCPQFDSCTLKSNKDIRCFNDESERDAVSLINNFVDNDDIDIIDDMQGRLIDYTRDAFDEIISGFTNKRTRK